MSSKPFPLTIYSSKRRQRSISNPHGRPNLSSSPLKVLSTEDEDITITEMSQRMRKRSRANMKRMPSGDARKAASVGTSPTERLDDARPVKRSKVQAHRTPLAELERTDNNAQTMLLGDDTQDMGLTSIAEMKTPAVSEVPTKPPKLKAPASDLDASEKDEESDFLSPLPTTKFAKRVTAHRSSSSLKEASRKSASGSLASPFNSRPGSPGRLNMKENRNKRINRTRSVGTDLRRRAALRSLSRAESPSSNASSPGIQKPSEEQAWSVPAHVKHSISQKTPRRPSETSVLPASETSFFDSAPIACSTPISKSTANLPQRRDIDATPKIPALNFEAFSDFHDSMILDDPTPRAPINTDSLLPSQTIPRAFTTVQERILSFESNSTDTSAKHTSGKTVTLSGSPTMAPPCSPTNGLGLVSPMSSDGDELHDMFSILGLDGRYMHLHNENHYSSNQQKTKPGTTTTLPVPAHLSAQSQDGKA